MPTSITDILAEADRLLAPSDFQDYGPNGLQVPGATQITTLITGVSAHVALFQQAIDAKADLILVHHGLFWGAGAGLIDLPLKRRLKLLFDSDIALGAYHLPLDAHPEIGNNALIARALGATGELRPFALHRNQPIGYVATLPGEGLPAHGTEGFFAKVELLMDQTPLVFDSGPERIRSFAIVTGAGTSHLPEAIAEGVDAFITGEPAERAMAEASEGSIHFIAAGHHATETFGIKALGEHLAERFDLRHRFIDVRNPI
jgi:dinuclear metal center YbgI/SA1388 family protein